MGFKRKLIETVVLFVSIVYMCTAGYQFHTGLIDVMNFYALASFGIVIGIFVYVSAIYHEIIKLSNIQSKPTTDISTKEVSEVHGK